MDITTAIEDCQGYFANPPPNEAATCEWVILPLLHAIGYDRTDVLAKSFDNGGKFPDYTLLPGDPKHLFYLEAKAWALGLEDGHANQALNYANQNGKRWVVLTNGQNWRLYDNDIRGLAKDKLVTEIALKDKDDALRLFEAIGKESVCADRLSQFAADEAVRRARVAEEREARAKREAEERESLIQQEARRRQVASVWKQESQQEQSPLVQAIIAHLNARPGLEKLTPAEFLEAVGLCEESTPNRLLLPPPQRAETGDSAESRLEGATEQVKAAYATLKQGVLALAPGISFNPQSTYVSIRGRKNLVYIAVAKTRLRLVIMLPEAELRQQIRKHNVTSLSKTAQRSWNGPCASVSVSNPTDIDEVIKAIGTLIRKFPPRITDAQA